MSRFKGGLANGRLASIGFCIHCGFSYSADSVYTQCGECWNVLQAIASGRGVKAGMWVRSTLTRCVKACLIGRGSRIEVQHFVGICCSGIWYTARSRFLNRRSAEIKGKQLNQKTEFWYPSLWGWVLRWSSTHTRGEKVVRAVGQVEYSLIGQAWSTILGLYNDFVE